MFKAEARPGPCRVVDSIEEADLPDHIEEELKQDVMEDGDLDEGEELVYDQTDMQARGIGFLREITLTRHAQYRMDQREINRDDVLSAIEDFFRWYREVKQTGRVTRSEREKLENLTRGQSIRFESKSTRLTIVFETPDPQKARLVTVFWTGVPDPGPPKSCATARRVASRYVDQQYDL